MSEEENVQFVLDGYARFNAGEARKAEPWFWHTDCEYHAAREDPDSAIHCGIDAITRQYASWLEAYPDLRVEPLEARVSGDEVFLWVAIYGPRSGQRRPTRNRVGPRHHHA